MSIYDQRTRAGNPRNPAKALYAHWHSILKNHWRVDSDGRPQGAVYFGRDHGFQITALHVYSSQNYPLSELGPPEYPHIQFGSFLLTRNGEFKVNYHFRGQESRNRIARNTFLDWNRTASRYQWFVNPSDELTSKYNNNLLTAWRNPVHYIQESLLTPGYLTPPYWLKLIRDPNYVGGWRIGFSRMSDLPKQHYFHDVDVPAMFEYYDGLQARRRKQRREEDLLASGELVLKGGRLRSSAEIEQRKQEQALALAAHLDVRMPAKTTPLKRTSEEEVDNGNHNLDAHDPHGAATLAPG